MDDEKNHQQNDTRCACGEMSKAACPGEWEPGCDLGANPNHVKPAETTEIAASVMRSIVIESAATAFSDLKLDGVSEADRPYLIAFRAMQELRKAQAEAEHERNRLAACGVAALSNTPESMAKLEADLEQSPYHSGSLVDVISAVKREMKYRAELEALRSA